MKKKNRAGLLAGVFFITLGLLAAIRVPAKLIILATSIIFFALFLVAFIKSLIEQRKYKGEDHSWGILGFGAASWVSLSSVLGCIFYIFEINFWQLNSAGFFRTWGLTVIGSILLMFVVGMISVCGGAGPD